MSQPRPRRRGVASALALVVVLAVALAACGSSGRDLREPDRNVTSPTRSVPTTAAPVTFSSLNLGSGLTTSTVPGTFPPAIPGVFDLATSDFVPGGNLPVNETCEGVSPALRWQGAPQGTTELALAVTEGVDGGTVHWLVTGIPPADGQVAAGETPVGGVALTNSLGVAGWSAPCPPPGQPEALNFVLLALTQPASVPAGTPATDAYRLLTEQAKGSVAVLTATASR